MLCGTTLEYLANKTTVKCSYCGEKFTGYIVCPNGHYVCEGCHNNSAIYVIKQTCAVANSTNPIEIFEKICNSPDIPMLGCHHAFMAAWAFITAIKNEGTMKVSDEMIEEIFTRTKQQAIGGYCGLTGICGIAPALGSCFAVILGSKCGMDREQKITMDVVVKIVEAIAELTGPSCCKAYARKALTIATDFLKDNLQIVLSSLETSIICNHTLNHPHGCRKDKCPYFKSI